MSAYQFMEFLIREERASDRNFIYDLIRTSFKNEDQVTLWEMLRNRKEFVKDLSLIYEIDGEIVGYILLSPVRIQTIRSSPQTLWLEPVCVLPKFQGKGIGKSIINSGLAKAGSLGFESVFVTGQFDFYCRFGFKEARNFGIKPSVQIPPHAFLAIELKKNSLKEQGILVYPEEIFG